MAILNITLHLSKETAELMGENVDTIIELSKELYDSNPKKLYEVLKKEESKLSLLLSNYSYSFLFQAHKLKENNMLDNDALIAYEELSLQYHYLLSKRDKLLHECVIAKSKINPVTQRKLKNNIKNPSNY